MDLPSGFSPAFCLSTTFPSTILIFSSVVAPPPPSVLATPGPHFFRNPKVCLLLLSATRLWEVLSYHVVECLLSFAWEQTHSSFGIGLVPVQCGRDLA